jgi:hypothetical protein
MTDHDYQIALDELDAAPAHKTSDARRARVAEARRQQRRGKFEYERKASAGGNGNVVPSMNEVIAEVQRLSMGTGIMPSIATFDAARPCTWEPAAAQLLRLGISWGELAQLAGLRPRGRQI